MQKNNCKKCRFCYPLCKKAQQNEALHPMRTTHILIDQGIFQIEKRADLPHAKAVGQIITVTFDLTIIL